MKSRYAIAAGFLAAFVVALIACWPLRAALGGRAEALGLSAQSVTGTLWSGRLVGAALGPVALGDVNARVGLLPLLTGQAEVSLRAERGPFLVDLHRDGRRLEVRDLDLVAPISALGMPGAASGQATASQATAVWLDDRCTEASGRLRIDGLAGPGWAAPPIDGRLACANGVLTATLTGEDALVGVAGLMAFQRDGRWALDLTARSNDPLVAAALAAQGFQPAQDGMTLTLTGRIAR